VILKSSDSLVRVFCWRWQVGDLAIWDNRVKMHYMFVDYLPEYRWMNRITVAEDRRS